MSGSNCNFFIKKKDILYKTDNFAVFSNENTTSCGGQASVTTIDVHFYHLSTAPLHCLQRC